MLIQFQCRIKTTNWAFNLASVESILRHRRKFGITLSMYILCNHRMAPYLERLVDSVKSMLSQ